MAESKLYKQLRSIDNTLTLMWLEQRMGMPEMDRYDLVQQLSEQQWASTDYQVQEMVWAIDDIRQAMVSQYEDIIKALKDSQIPPLEAEVRERLARAKDNEKHGLYEEALEDLKLAEEKNPYDFGIHLWLGSLYLQHMEDANAAITHYEKAVRYATPRSEVMAARAWSGVALGRETLGDLQGAYDASQEAVRLDPNSAAILYEHSAHCAQVMEAQEALTYLEQAIRRSPVYWDAAESDERFDALGDAVPRLLNELSMEVREALQRLAGKHAQLTRVTSAWEIAPEMLSPKRFAPLEGELQDLLAALEQGGYADQVAAVSRSREILPSLTALLKARLEKQIGEAEKALDEARSSIRYQRNAAAEAEKKMSLPTTKTVIWGIGALVALLMTGVCGVTQVFMVEETLDKVCGGAVVIVLGAALIFLALRARNSYQEATSLKKDIADHRNTADRLTQEGLATKARLQTLEAQHTSLAALVEKIGD